MSLENSEILKNVSILLADIGNAVKMNSDGEKKITLAEWVSLGTKFFSGIGADLIDEDED